MHVYLMLRELDPPAARSLCEAMRRAAGDDSVWVYYARTPLLAYLGAAQLRGLGCSISIPPERLGHVAPGQEVWVNVVRRLVASLGSPPDGRDRRAISALLARLGANDFALLRSTPPLLYHNDLTASVSRYYWSTDAGYALWLRLYAALGAR